MKKTTPRLELKKLKIAKLNNLSSIRGGGDGDDPQRSFPLHNCKPTIPTQGNGIIEDVLD